MRIYLIILLTALTLNGQTPKASPVSEINSYAAQIDRFTRTSSARYFGDTSLEEKSAWKTFKTKKSLDNAGDVYQKALVWTRAGKVVSAVFTLSSPSGDWAHFVTYYFRADGSLAKIHAELNTFYGEVSIIRDRWYDSSANQISATKKILDLNTRKPKKPSGDFMDQEITVYKKVTDLPFSKLL